MCPICDSNLKTAVLVNRPDYEFNIPYQLDYFRCGNCGLVYADPIPSALIPSFYNAYSTHQQQSRKSFFSHWTDALTMPDAVRAIGTDKAAKILDYGCGSGAFLGQLRHAGYTNLTGYDFDPKAVEVARSLGIKIFDREEDLPGKFDVITLNHVLEHLENPVEDIGRLVDFLVPGGVLLMRTPNSTSLLATLRGSEWRGWETPRHLNVFSPKAAKQLIERLSPLERVSVHTSNALWFAIFHGSLRGGRNLTGKIARHAVAFAGLPVALLLNAVFGKYGEELVIVARRNHVEI
jgi:SAM-dependent methyltransferase